MQTLGSYGSGRDNNFNLIRFTAAMMVMLSHSFALATGNYEPWHETLGITPGSLAVEIFFVTSGYLVAASLYVRGDLTQFALARVLRIYPGLLVAVVASTVVFGVFFSTLSFSEFISHRKTWSYMVRNVALVLPGGLTWTLPGVFADHISGPAVNGSLWSLVYEVRMYALLALMWVVIVAARRSRRWLGPASIAVMVFAFACHFATRGDTLLTAWRVIALFFAGSAMYVWRDRVPVSWALFGALLAVTLLAALDRTVFGFVWLFTLPYLVLFLAHEPGGFIRRFNRIGDFSYGLYIYAFPVQKIVVALLPGIASMELFVVSSFATMVLAVASWHWVEAPALRLKDRVWTGTRRLQSA